MAWDAVQKPGACLLFQRVFNHKSYKGFVAKELLRGWKAKQSVAVL